MGCVLLYFLPPVHERLAWRIANLESQVRRYLQPPEELLFVPQGAEADQAVATMVQATLDALAPNASATPTMPPASPTPNLLASTPQPTFTPTPQPSDTPTPTALPERYLLEGILHEYQQFNNCGPANLSMTLSFWGWKGTQRNTRAFLRPNLQVDDKNVNPSEMVQYVHEFTELRAVARVGGDVELLRQLIAAGFPVLVEKGHDPNDDWWMGHYVVFNGYDNQSQRLIAQDSLTGPDVLLPYHSIMQDWRSFNYQYLVIYPPERESEVFALLGEHADERENMLAAAARARQETDVLTGRELFFAWFNLGSSLVGLEDFSVAAFAYDQAFAIYATLPEEPEHPESRPYRMMWYQAGPYLAYYYSARYQDVINLANATLSWLSKPVLEETYYWRGMAYEAQGEVNLAISDFQKAANLNPNYAPPRQALQRLGVAAP